MLEIHPADTGIPTLPGALLIALGITHETTCRVCGRSVTRSVHEPLPDAHPQCLQARAS